MVSSTIFKLWFEYDLCVVAHELKLELEKTLKKAEFDALIRKGRLAKIQRQRASQQLKNKYKMEKKRAARSQHQRTCQFWTSEYAKTRASYDLTMKKTACKPMR